MNDANGNESYERLSAEEETRMKEFRDWLAFAQTDYDSAEYLSKAPFHPKPMNVICYHCQQAAEKALKALIVYFEKDGGIPKVHDLSFLLNQIKNDVSARKGITISVEFATKVDQLTKYGVASRYPNEIEIDEIQTSKALRDCSLILNWVKRVVDAEPGRQQS